jgi:protein SCO1/2
MHRKRTLVALIAATTVAVALALILLIAHPQSRTGAVSSGGSSPSGAISAAGFAGATLPSGVPRHDFALQDQSGRRVSLAAFGGEVSVLAFVSSTCGAACTLIAQQIRGALDELAHPPPVLLVSVDPSGDTPARVSRFLAQVSLTSRAHYLTGPLRALRSIWREYGVRPPSAGRAAFERSAAVTVIDRSGRARVIFGLEQLTPEGLAHDIRKLS